jgi:hypothetical protein
MYPRSWPVCLLVVAACGRLDFAAIGDHGDDGATDAPATGPTGTRYLIELDANATAPTIAGKQGRVAVLEGFEGATTIAGTALAGQAMYASSGLVWFDPTGAVTASTVLDSTSICEIRALGGVLAGDGVLAVGISEATVAMPAYGPCAIATSRQDGIAIAIDPAGGQSLVADVVSQTFNIQSWFATGFRDGSIAIAGVYGGGGMLGAASLPVTGSDENSFLARVDPATGEPRWGLTVNSADELGSGPIDSDGDELCAMGEFSGTMSVFDIPLTAVGLRDAWIARLDHDGHARFVRDIGSTAQESTGAGTSIVATSDGGCTVVLPVIGDVAIDSFSLPASQGSDVLVRFDATGTAIAATRIGGRLQLARLGDRIFGALPCSAASCALGDLSYTAVGDDIAIASLDPQLHATLIAALTGGATTLDQLTAIPPDALAIAFGASAATTSLGALSLSPEGSVNALGVLGVAP